MLLVETVLAGILAVATPGSSLWSRVELPEDLLPCDAACQASVAALSGAAPARGYRIQERVSWAGLSRQETCQEGMARFVTVARAVAAVAADPPEGWVWGPEPLWRGLVVIARHESGLWRSVHEGRLRGLAGEWGLWQCHPSLEGCDASMSGIDLESTTRAARFAAGLLTRARRFAERRCIDEWWFAGTIGVYGSGTGCVAEDWVDARIATYAKIDFRAEPLPAGAWMALTASEARLGTRVRTADVHAPNGVRWFEEDD